MTTNKKVFTEILTGLFNNIPEDRSKLVRIFLSSTFKDTYCERDYLIENVIPKLKSYAKKEHGLELQIVDMRWGINDEASNTHSTVDICLNEIKNCQKHSLGPNFISILSHRYGTSFLPNQIPQNVYEAFHKVGEKHECRKLMDICYKLDENYATNKSYKLKNIDDIMAKTAQKQKFKDFEWEAISEKLDAFIKYCAKKCLELNFIDQKEFERYHISITENESIIGTFDAKNVADNVLVFVREIEDLENQIFDKNINLVSKFTELNENGQVSIETKERINKLKTKFRKIVPSSNIFDFKIRWAQNEGVSKQLHKDYLDNFGKTFYDSVKMLIERNVKKKTFMEEFNKKDQELLHEVILHARFVKRCVNRFRGREDLIEKLEEYINSEKTCPLVVFGESGSGKSSLIAKVVDKIRKNMNDEKTVVIVRFLGTTAGTSSAVNTFYSILYQLERVMGIEPTTLKFENILHLREFLVKRLYEFKQFYPNKRLIILLDSIDQLIASDYELNWFICEFPDTVKMIYSTLSTHYDILESLIERVDSENFLEVGPLDISIAETMINDWLAQSNRQLTALQWEKINLLLVSQELYPLYIKLLFDIIVFWTSSYVPGEEFFELKTIKDCIHYQFNYLEKQHGRKIFSRLMSYMTILNGISENELEDICSLDDDLLDHVFIHHVPPIRRFPISLWMRIKNDLSEYIVEREIDESRVICWYHRCFHEVATEKYVLLLKKIDDFKNSSLQKINNNIFEYFTEKWVNKEKTFHYSEHIAKKKGVKPEQKQLAHRYVSSQPNSFESEGGEKIFNKRKLNILPLIIGKMSTESFIMLAAQYIVFNYDFLYNKLSICDPVAFLFQELLSHPYDDTVSAEARDTNYFLTIFKQTFCTFMTSINRFPHNLAFQLVSRLAVLYNKIKYFRELIDQCDKLSPSHCALIVPYQFYPLQGAVLQYINDSHLLPIHSIIFVDGNIFTCSDKLHFYGGLGTLGEITFLHTDKELYKRTRIYFNKKPSSYTAQELIKGNVPKMNTFSGGFVVSSNNYLYHMEFNEQLVFEKRFNDDEIEDFFIIKKFLLIQFKNKNYFEVYNLFDGEIVKRYSFSFQIKYILFNWHNIIAYDLESKQAHYLTIISNEAQIQVYQVNDEPNANWEYLEHVNTINQAGFECTSAQLSFLDCGDDVEGIMFGNDLLVTFEEGGFCIIRKINEKSQCTIEYVLPLFEDILEDTKDKITLKIVDFKENKVLFIGSNQQLYLYNVNDKEKKLRSIPGNYENGVIDTPMDNLVLATSKGTIELYQISDKSTENSNVYEVAKLLQSDLHYDEITYLMLHKTQLFSISKDTTMKYCFMAVELRNSTFGIKFDHSKFDINNLTVLDNEHVLAYSNDLRVVDVWNVKEGRLINSIETEIDFIENVLSFKGFCYLIGKNTVSDRKLNVIKMFNYKEKATEMKRFKLGELIENCSKIILIERYKKLCLFCELPDMTSGKKFHLFSINQTQNSTNMKFDLVYADLENLIRNCEDLEIANKNMNFSIDLDCLTLTYQSGYLVFYKDGFIYYIYPVKNVHRVHCLIQLFKSCIAYGDLNCERRIVKIYPIKDTNDLLIHTTLGEMMYVSYNKEGCLLRVIENRNGTKITKFEIKRHILATYSETTGELVIQNFKDLVERKSFDHFSMKKVIKNLEFFAISADCNYVATFEYPKLLSLFRIKDGNRIAYISMHGGIESIKITDEYVCLAMKERRVLSLLIVDPLEKSHADRIKRLPSRQVKEIKNEEDGLVNMLKESLEKATNQEFDLNEKLFDVNSDEEKQKRSILSYPLIDTFSLIQDNKVNWLIEFHDKIENSLGVNPLNVPDHNDTKTSQTLTNSQELNRKDKKVTSFLCSIS